MKKIINTLLLSIVLPICVGIAIYWFTRANQPENIVCAPYEPDAVMNYILPDELYGISGSFLVYPGVTLSPSALNDSSYSYMEADSIDVVRSNACLVNGRYVATVKFYITVPDNMKCGMLLPGQFCEYRVYVNSQLRAYTNTFYSQTPSYPSPHKITFPESKDGHYEVVFLLVSPENFKPASYDDILFGSDERITKNRELTTSAGFIMLSFVLFTILFYMIQLVAMRKQRMLISFIILLFASLLRVLLSDNVLIAQIFPKFPYQLGVLLEGLCVPIFLLALLLHEYSLYFEHFPKPLAIVTAISQIVPLINTLTFSKLQPIVRLSMVTTVLPYVVCYIVLFMAIIKQEKYTGTFCLGLTCVVLGAQLQTFTRSFTIPSKYNYAYGIVAFSIIEIINISRIYSKQEEAESFYADELNRTIEKMQSKENAFLNAQMKPHFLYNTLNTIADLCVVDPPKAQRLIASLNEYLTMVLELNNMDETVPLAHEIKLAKTYASIEKERFPTIEFYYDFPIRLPRIQMPALILQPLVENAIKHGVRKIDKPGIITIYIREDYENVWFFVSDNGIGMDEKVIDKLFEIPKENKSIGIYNIDKRLKNLYGKGLSIESTVGLGTCISFCIPKFI